MQLAGCDVLCNVVAERFKNIAAVGLADGGRVLRGEKMNFRDRIFIFQQTVDNAAEFYRPQMKYRRRNPQFFGKDVGDLLWVTATLRFNIR